MKRRYRSTAKWLFFIALIFVWEFSKVPQYLLPKPSSIVLEGLSQWKILMDHSLYTILEAFSGLVIGLVLGVGLAVLMDLFQTVKEVMYPILIISQAIPIVAVAPLVIIWFGLGVGTKIGIVAFVTLFPVALNTLEGFRTIDQDALDLFKVMKATKIQIYRYLVIPHTLPYVLSGLKISATYAVVSAVIGEWLGAEKGLGIYMIRAMNTFRADRLFLSVIVVVVLSVVVFKIADILSRKLTPWFEERRLVQ
ncbi:MULTISPECIES: ABC transporter permease [unclassified Thermotoga]|uniref:ABC transporter permease n=1 Tax=unclassified Thermotoga TaxID=2631113 RepID=UPI000280E983|nr:MULTISPECIES: ABC transporter permease [unclassified Thermotoga]AIY86001.1 ABC transporter permease [Thermotoga sp. 2812B]EJX26714.1 ABC transporter permease [Thermotoga sp. EMP]